MRFTVTWVEERSGYIDAADIKKAEAEIRKTLDKNPRLKLLSIVRVDPAPMAPLSSAA